MRARAFVVGILVVFGAVACVGFLFSTSFGDSALQPVLAPASAPHSASAVPRATSIWVRQGGTANAASTPAHGVSAVYVWPLNLLSGTGAVVQPDALPAGDGAVLSVAFLAVVQAAYPGASISWTSNPVLLERGLNTSTRAVAFALPDTNCTLFPVPNMKHVPLVTATSDSLGPISGSQLWRATPDLSLSVTAATPAGSHDDGAGWRWSTDDGVPGSPGDVEPRVAQVVRSLLDSRQQAMSDVQEIRSWGPFKEKRVIAFSLWLPPHASAARGYVAGARANALLAAKYFPGWTVRFYIDGTTVGPRNRAKLNATGTEEIVVMEAAPGSLGMLWRFLPASDPTVDRFIVRDTDSRLSARDAFAVQEWVTSGKAVHILHEVPAHGAFIMGGMLGARKSAFPDMKTLVDRKLHNEKVGYGEDQKFLEWVWKTSGLTPDDAMHHDAIPCRKQGKQMKQSRMFPTQRLWSMEFVGFVVGGEGLEYSGEARQAANMGCQPWVPVVCDKAPPRNSAWLYG